MSWGMMTAGQLQVLKLQVHKEPEILTHDEFCEQLSIIKNELENPDSYPTFQPVAKLVKHNKTLDKKAALVPLLLEEIRQAIITLGVSGNNTEAARLMIRMKELTGDDQSGFKFNAPIKT